MADFSWSGGRGAGVFMHVSSLPSEFGVGNIGAAAQPFFDFLEKSGMTYWQICPLGPTGYGDSPYQSFSTFAGNPYFIDLRALQNARLVEEAELEPLKNLPRDRCDYGALYSIIPPLLKRAAARYAEFPEGFELGFGESFSDFCKRSSDWIEPYALFSALKNRFGGRPWYEWDAEFSNFASARRQKLSAEFEADIFSVKFVQWVFFGQYAKFRAEAGKRGISIFGDIPIFLAHDSADVWGNPSLFDMNKDGSLRNVAGVGPDYFCAEGQLWGNPLYDWRGSRKAVYDFWKRRVAASLEMYDVIRLDHFRGFADYWAIPAASGDARKGSWKIGPGEDFFDFLRGHFKTQKFVAEDLGLLSQRAFDLRDKINIPAMAVMQFAFGDTPQNPYLPHNIVRECVYYTGTHDNDTARGWYGSASERARDELRRYFRSSGEEANWDMIHAVMLSVARLAIIPMQDICGLGSECRMNTPGKPQGNWQWRLTEGQLSSASKFNCGYLRSLAILGARSVDKKDCAEK